MACRKYSMHVHNNNWSFAAFIYVSVPVSMLNTVYVNVHVHWIFQCADGAVLPWINQFIKIVE